MLGIETMSSSDEVTIRRELTPGDIGAVTALHGSLYAAEYGMGPLFEADVAAGLARAAESGWPERCGGAWIVEADGRVAGSMAWTDEADHAKVRWVLLHPDLRGRGLARSMLAELLREVEDAGHELVVLDTFSDLRVARRHVPLVRLHRGPFAASRTLGPSRSTSEIRAEEVGVREAILIRPVRRRRTVRICCGSRRSTRLLLSRRRVDRRSQWRDPRRHATVAARSRTRSRRLPAWSSPLRLAR